MSRRRCGTLQGQAGQGIREGSGNLSLVTGVCQTLECLPFQPVEFVEFYERSESLPWILLMPQGCPNPMIVANCTNPIWSGGLCYGHGGPQHTVFCHPVKVYLTVAPRPWSILVTISCLVVSDPCRVPYDQVGRREVICIVICTADQ